MTEIKNKYFSAYNHARWCLEKGDMMLNVDFLQLNLSSVYEWWSMGWEPHNDNSKPNLFGARSLFIRSPEKPGFKGGQMDKFGLAALVRKLSIIGISDRAVIAPVQPIYVTWRCRIENSMVTSLTVRKRIGSFTDAERAKQTTAAFEAANLFVEGWLPEPNCFMDIALLETEETFLDTQEFKIIDFFPVNEEYTNGNVEKSEGQMNAEIDLGTTRITITRSDMFDPTLQRETYVAFTDTSLHKEGLDSIMAQIRRQIASICCVSPVDK